MVKDYFVTLRKKPFLYACEVMKSESDKLQDEKDLILKACNGKDTSGRVKGIDIELNVLNDVVTAFENYE